MFTIVCCVHFFVCVQSYFVKPRKSKSAKFEPQSNEGLLLIKTFKWASAKIDNFIWFIEEEKNKKEMLGALVIQRYIQSHTHNLLKDNLEKLRK